MEARIENLPGISGHADKHKLLEWLGNLKKAPSKIFVVHGDDQVCDAFAADIQRTYGYDAMAPYSGDTFDLLTGECIAQGSRVVVQKKKTATKAVSNVFARLVAAGERLMHVIEGCEGMANKDLAKFADQINALCDKWSR